MIQEAEVTKAAICRPCDPKPWPCRLSVNATHAHKPGSWDCGTSGLVCDHELVGITRKFAVVTLLADIVRWCRASRGGQESYRGR